MAIDRDLQTQNGPESEQRRQESTPFSDRVHSFTSRLFSASWIASLPKSWSPLAVARSQRESAFVAAADAAPLRRPPACSLKRHQTNEPAVGSTKGLAAAVCSTAKASSHSPAHGQTALGWLSTNVGWFTLLLRRPFPAFPLFPTTRQSADRVSGAAADGSDSRRKKAICRVGTKSETERAEEEV